MKLFRLIFFNWPAKFALRISDTSEISEKQKRNTLVIREFMYLAPILFILYFCLQIPARIIESIADLDFLSGAAAHVLVIIFIIISFNKDFFGGQSVVNRYWGYKVIDLKTNSTAGPFKCLLRNITIPISPLEFFVLETKANRRIGNYIAGTTLVKVEPTSPEQILEDIKGFKFDLASITILILPALPYLLLWIWMLTDQGNNSIEL